TISIAPATTLADGVVGTSYSQTFTASGGAGGFAYQITSGLPVGLGLSINPSTGQLAGTPAQSGNFLITGTATHRNRCSGGRTYALKIPPAVTSTVPANGANNVAVNTTVTINFSESVAAGAGAFSLQCPSGTPVTFGTSASPAASYTLTPTSNLPAGTVC